MYNAFLEASFDASLSGGFPAFAFRISKPANKVQKTFILLHGSGTDETTLIPLARQIAPDALLLAVRGRVAQEGGWRWFERITPTRFGQESIRAEAAAFVTFVTEAARHHGFDVRDTTFLGYSNGANLVSSIMLLHPGKIRRAVLLRSMPVLDNPPATSLAGTQALVIAGEADVTYAPYAPDLVNLLETRGAEVEAHTIAAGHEFGATDASIISDWLMRPQRPKSTA